MVASWKVYSFFPINLCKHEKNKQTKQQKYTEVLQSSE